MVKVDPDGTITLKLTFPWADIKSTYSQALKAKAATTEIKGFRPGKAPLDRVEKVIDPSQLYQDAFTKVFIKVYHQILTQHHLHPLLAPQIKPLQTKIDQDWQVEVLTAQTPQFDITGYQTAVSAALAKDKLWLPGKTTSPQDSADKKLSLVLDTLLKHFSFPVSPLLINQETNQALSRLLDQVNHLGLTIDQYLTSTHRTPQQLREEYNRTAATNLRLEFILQAIAQDLHLTITDSKINEFIASAPSQDQKQLQTPDQKAHLVTLLRKQAALDALLNL